VQAFARKMPPRGETVIEGETGGGTPCRIGGELLSVFHKADYKYQSL